MEQDNHLIGSLESQSGSVEIASLMEMDGSTFNKARKRSRRQAAPWSREETRHLVKAIQGHECLWDANSTGYKDKCRRERAWVALSRVVEHDEEDCIAKWNALRTNYRALIIKRKKDLQDTFEGKQLSEPYSQMGFLLPMLALVSRNKDRNTNRGVKKEENESRAIGNTSTDNSNSNIETLRPKRNRTVQYDPEWTDDDVQHIKQPECDVFSCSSDQNAISEASVSTSLDRNETFIKYVLSELRSLSDDKARFVRGCLSRCLVDSLETVQNNNQ